MARQSNQDRSKDIAKLIRDWISQRESKKDTSEWIQTQGPTAYKGVNRTKLAKELGVSKSSLNDNDAAPELRNAEFRWCREYLSKQDTSKANSAEIRRAREGEKRARKKVSSLEGNNEELLAENRLLRLRLAKWEALENILLESGRMPREPFVEER